MLKSANFKTLSNNFQDHYMVFKCVIILLKWRGSLQNAFSEPLEHQTF